MNKELLVFNIYKDVPMTRKNVQKIRAKYKDIDVTAVRAKIVNYQIEKYGISLQTGRGFNYESKEDLHRKNDNWQKRRKSKYKTKEWY